MINYVSEKEKRKKKKKEIKQSNFSQRRQEGRAGVPLHKVTWDPTGATNTAGVAA